MVILGAPRASKPHHKVMSKRNMIAETHSSIISKTQLNLIIKTEITNIKVKIEVFRTFGGHRVILGAPGAPKPNDRVMSPRDVTAETHRSIISKAQLNRTTNS